MASEKNWAHTIISPVSISGAVITMPTVYGLKVKRNVTLSKLGVVSRVFQVKRVVNENTIWVGEVGTPITQLKEVDEYDGGVLSSGEDARNTIGSTPIIRAVYEEEPTVALRTIGVDWLGELYSEKNPFPVYLADALLDTDLTNEFNLVSSVVKDAATPLFTYTVPADKKMELMRIHVGGDNIATYDIYKNGIMIGKTRTYFSGPLTTSIEFAVVEKGWKFNPSDVLHIKVTHSRPWVGEFEAMVQMLLK